MAMISMSFLECPNCKAKMQSVTTMKCGMFFHIWTCIHCGDYYDRQELIEKVFWIKPMILKVCF